MAKMVDRTKPTAIRMRLEWGPASKENLITVVRDKKRKPKIPRFNTKSAGIRDAQRLGYFVHDVERHLFRSFITIDFLGKGGGDILLWKKCERNPGADFLLVNTTTEGELKTHVDDAMANNRLRTEWLNLGMRFEIWSYPDREDRESGDTGFRRIPIG